jgi:hypothetical protein
MKRLVEMLESVFLGHLLQAIEQIRKGVKRLCVHTFPAIIP